MSDLFISPFHPAYRKPDVVSPLTPAQASSKEHPSIDWQKPSKGLTPELIIYDRFGRTKEYRHDHMGAICFIIGK
jgi:hypothetical protein